MKKKHMIKRGTVRCFLVLCCTWSLMAIHTFAWTDQTHMAVGLAAGFSRFQNCPAADLSHTVAVINGLTQTDGQAHFFNVSDDYELSVDDAYAQLEDIGKSQEECPNGYLLGAILHTTRLCKEKTESGAYDDEYYAVLLHYVVDLAQPLHMSEYDDFNKKYHFACDDILSDKEAEYPVFAAVALADEITVDEELHFETEEELLGSVIGLAKQSQSLAKEMRAQERMITREEAIRQISDAASLGRALMRYCGKIR